VAAVSRCPGRSWNCGAVPSGRTPLPARRHPWWFGTMARVRGFMRWSRSVHPARFRTPHPGWNQTAGQPSASTAWREPIPTSSSATANPRAPRSASRAREKPGRIGIEAFHSSPGLGPPQPERIDGKSSRSRAPISSAKTLAETGRFSGFLSSSLITRSETRAGTTGHSVVGGAGSTVARALRVLSRSGPWNGYRPVVSQ